MSKKLTKWINVFRTGTHTDSSGKTKTWTKDHLDTIVSRYAKRDEVDEAPLVLGHPKDNDPAYGDLKATRRKGDFLQVRFARVPQKLREAVDNGRYKNRSISLTPKLDIRHVGLLGAVPPAVKGLGPLSFGEEDAIVVEMNFNEAPETGEDDMTKERIAELEAQLADANKRADAESANREKAEKDLKDRERDFAEADEKRRKEVIAAKIDGLVEKGAVLPSEKDRVAAFAQALDTESEDISFSESDGKRPLVDHFWDYLESGQKHGLFNEFSAPDGGSQDGTDYGNLAAKM